MRPGKAEACRRRRLGIFAAEGSCPLRQQLRIIHTGDALQGGCQRWAYQVWAQRLLCPQAIRLKHRSKTLQDGGRGIDEGSVKIEHNGGHGTGL